MKCGHPIRLGMGRVVPVSWFEHLVSLTTCGLFANDSIQTFSWVLFTWHNRGNLATFFPPDNSFLFSVNSSVLFFDFGRRLGAFSHGLAMLLALVSQLASLAAITAYYWKYRITWTRYSRLFHQVTLYVPENNVNCIDAMVVECWSSALGDAAFVS